MSRDARFIIWCGLGCAFTFMFIISLWADWYPPAIAFALGATFEFMAAVANRLADA